MKEQEAEARVAAVESMAACLVVACLAAVMVADWATEVSSAGFAEVAKSADLLEVKAAAVQRVGVAEVVGVMGQRGPERLLAVWIRMAHPQQLPLAASSRCSMRIVRCST